MHMILRQPTIAVKVKNYFLTVLVSAYEKLVMLLRDSHLVRGLRDEFFGLQEVI